MTTYRVSPIQGKIAIRCLLYAMAYDSDQDHVNEKDDGGEDCSYGSDDKGQEGWKSCSAVLAATEHKKGS